MGNPKPEIVIGLAGPIGTDLNIVSSKIEEILNGYEYKSANFKISDLIFKWCDEDLQKEIDDLPFEQRVDYLMNAGDTLRVKQKKGDALIPAVMTAIRKFRKNTLDGLGYKTDDNQQLELYNQCYIINSLKHPDEINTLQQVYGEKFILISAFSDIETRLNNLCEKIAKSHHSTSNKDFEDKAKALIEKDSDRPDAAIGQSLSKAFHKADFFLRVGPDIDIDLNRFFEVYFGNPYMTPRRDEFFMFEAKANSFRSADLSRQVGAIIINNKNDIVARGCNEVPIPGGGAFWSDDKSKKDNRDYQDKRDFNDVKKIEILEELFNFLQGKDLDDHIELKESSGKIVDDLVFGPFRQKFKKLRVSNLIEFGRVVHAEMFALMEAARRGLSVERGTLFCTTFPCHMCARHIIASGIRKIIYIEPYPKSMTKELFPETVSVDSNGGEKSPKAGPQNQVVFLPFEGVAPNLYTRLFGYSRRKDDRGYTIDWKRKSAQPKIPIVSNSHLPIELTTAKAVESLPNIGKVDIVNV